MVEKNKNGGGFIQIVLVIIVALVLLKYIYDIDVIGFLTQGKFREILDRFYEFGSKGWEKYGDLITRLWSYLVDFVKNIADKIK